MTRNVGTQMRNMRTLEILLAYIETNCCASNAFCALFVWVLKSTHINLIIIFKIFPLIFAWDILTLELLWFTIYLYLSFAQKAPTQSDCRIAWLLISAKLIEGLLWHSCTQIDKLILLCKWAWPDMALNQSDFRIPWPAISLELVPGFLHLSLSLGLMIGSFWFFPCK